MKKIMITTIAALILSGCYSMQSKPFSEYSCEDATWTLIETGSLIHDLSFCF